MEQDDTEAENEEVAEIFAHVHHGLLDAAMDAEGPSRFVDSQRPQSRNSRRPSSCTGGQAGEEISQVLAGGRQNSRPALPWPGGGGDFRTLNSSSRSLNLSDNQFFPLPPERAIEKDRLRISGGIARLSLCSGETISDLPALSSAAESKSIAESDTVSSTALLDHAQRPISSVSCEYRDLSGSSLSSRSVTRSGLLGSRNSRVQAEHHFQMLKSRVTKLEFEEQRAQKTALVARLRADEVVRLRQEVQTRQQLRNQRQGAILLNTQAEARHKRRESQELREATRRNCEDIVSLIRYRQDWFIS